MPEGKGPLDIEISDVDRDALHILPLAILPIQTPALRRARLIKNQALEGVVEMFSTDHAGSGQMDVEHLPQEFSWKSPNAHPDMKILTKLKLLPSYDVYGLRISLRNLKIDVERHDALKLSQSMNRRLTGYMSAFTRPLILQIYGSSELSIQSVNDILKLFRDPDPKQAYEKLTTMADKLGIRVTQIPSFIEEYGDIFLSLSYYRKCMKDVRPMTEEFLETLQSIRTSSMSHNYPGLDASIDAVEDTINFLSHSIERRLNSFDEASRNMWETLSAARFHDVKSLIESHHVFIGGALCALVVKIDGWFQKFPSSRHGSFPARCEFLNSHMKLGIGRVKEMLRKAMAGTAPMRALE